MIRGFISRHRPLAITSLIGVVVVALITTVAIVSGGFVQQRMVLGDSAVWVANGTAQMVGRANTQIGALNSAVTGGTASLDVVQHDTEVLLVDHGDNSVERVNAASVTTGKSVALPPRDAQVGIAGSRAVVESLATGQIWFVPLDQLNTFTATSKPTIDLGGRVVTSLAPDGTLFAYSIQSKHVYRIDSADGSVSQTWTLTGKRLRGTDVQISSVGDQWAVYDASTRVLRTESGPRTLPAEVGDAGVLQQASDGSGDLVVASAGGVFMVPFDGGAARQVTAGAFGSAPAPAVVGGCVYAAWTNGQTWRSCVDGAAGRSGTLSGLRAGAELEFRVNGDAVVLNDSVHGTTWAVQHGNRLIDNWSDFAQPNDKAQTEENVEDKPPTYEKQQQPPVAVDDKFGARPGVTSPLPVLLNDYDPNGDVLAIDSFTPIPESFGTVQIVDNGQQLQIELPADAHGQIQFEYTISDGRGGQANAQVTVTVRAPNENSPPVQVQTAKATVASGGRVTAQVLAGWYDPDGDPFYVTSASVAGPDSVTFTADGTVVFTDAGKGGSVKTVTIVVSDGRSEGTGTLLVTVRPPTEVPIITDPFIVDAMAGDAVTISPLDHVRGGSGAIRLTAVPEKPDITVSPDFDNGTFGFQADTPGSYYVDYSVSDGYSTASGEVRVVVSAPSDSGDVPVTVPHTAFIEEQSTKDVDVLDTDFDPAGGVLLVTAAQTPQASAGVRVDVLAQSTLRITLTRPLDGPVSFTYTVSNGTAQAQGTVRVVQIPRPPVMQPPVANPDSATVRVGDVIDIPVLDNDTQADGEQLTLDPTLARGLPAGAGLLFASGTELRYLAPEKPGNYTAVYRVDAPDGQWATAAVTISVREIDAQTNHAPVPKTVTARVLTGNTVRIPIPLDGTDPDGDTVKLVGASTNPQKGIVTATGQNWIDYQAGDYSAGTDTFDYTVVDALGAHADGTVRVGIAPDSQGARNPVAVADEVEVRPGRTLTVQVLANDSDPDGSPLTVTKVAPTADGVPTPKIVSKGTAVKVVAPKTEGRYGFIYTIQNDTGGTSSNFLTLDVRKDAPLSRPVVQDTVLSLSDILGRTSVTADPLSNVFFADGDVSTLRLSIVPGYSDTASVTSNQHVRIRIEDSAQIIPFKVTNPDDASLFSYGFIWVPGFDDALPQLKQGMPKLTIPSEKTLVIDLDDYVIAAGGKHVTLTDAAHVHATHSNGADLVRGNHTLVFTSAARYFGPASISFEVTDGSSANDPNAHVVTLTLPITVTPRSNQPPTFTGAQVDFEPGQQKTLDLLKLTSYPYQKDKAELAYSILNPLPSDASASIHGQTITIQVSDRAQKGSQLTFSIGVRDAVSNGTAGRITVLVVPSTRPLAVPRADTVVATRGTTTTVDVLANDEATNPFPATPLRVIAVRGISDANLPAGVTVRPSADRSRLTVTVSSSAQPANTTLQYEVADATGDPARYTWGVVTIQVEDRPDPVANLQITGVGDKQLTVAWSPGAANNSPISGYTVTLSAPGGGEIASTRCASTTCTVPTPGNGPSNAVTVSVTATNGIGTSVPVTYGDAVWSNVVPAAPTGLQVTSGDGQLAISWNPPGSNGASSVTGYQVTVGSTSVTVPGGTTSYTATGLRNGQQYAVTVAAMNSFYGAQPVWNSVSGSGTPAGAPIFSSSSPSVSFSSAGDGNATVTWSVGANGSSITAVSVTANGQSCGNPSPSSTSTACQVPTGGRVAFTVTATNSVGSTSASTSAVAHSAPSNVTATFAAPDPSQKGGNPGLQTGVYLPTVASVSSTYDSGGSVSYSYAFSPSGGTAVSVGSTVGGADLTQYYGKTMTVFIAATVTYSDGTTYTTWSSGIPTPTVAVTVPAGAWSFQAASQGQGGTFSWTVSPAPAGTVTCNGNAADTATNTCTTTSNKPVLEATTTANNGLVYTNDYAP